MRKTHTRLLRKITGLFLAGAMVAGSIATPLGTTKVLAQDTKSDDEIMLGVFFTSEEDTTDTLYWSKDGVNFYQLAEAYTDATPDDNKSSIIKYTAQDKAEYEAKYPNPEFRAPFARKDVTLHDPGIIYKDGYFWMISGNTTSAANAATLNGQVKNAIKTLNEQRSNLGAVQNRLEHTINNLDNVVENTTSAESRIRDTDMATEMVKYSNTNILAQAGQAMLAQSNQANQGVLSLLQ